MCCGMLNSIPGLHPLDASSTTPLRKPDRSPDNGKCPLGAKSPSVENRLHGWYAHQSLLVSISYGYSLRLLKEEGRETLSVLKDRFLTKQLL